MKCDINQQYVKTDDPHFVKWGKWVSLHGGQDTLPNALKLMYIDMFVRATNPKRGCIYIFKTI